MLLTSVVLFLCLGLVASEIKVVSFQDGKFHLIFTGFENIVDLEFEYKIDPLPEVHFTRARKEAAVGRFLWVSENFHKRATPGNGIHVRAKAQTPKGIFVQETSGILVHEPHTRRVLGANVVFRDDFEVWDPSFYIVSCTATGEGNGAGEFQVYTPQHRNIYAHDGNLYIEPTLTIDNEPNIYFGTMNLYNMFQCCTLDPKGAGCVVTAGQGTDILPPVMSGEIQTRKSLLYGRVMIRAKLAKGDWLMPKIKMRPVESYYGSWPRSGEIGIVRSRGNTVVQMGTSNKGINWLESSLHWGPDETHDMAPLTSHEKFATIGDYSGWHLYTMEWTPEHIRMTVDGETIKKFYTPLGGYALLGGFNNFWSSGSNNAPFDRALVIGLAVGGTGTNFPDSATYSSIKPWNGDMSSPHPKTDFWEARSVWEQSWTREDTHLAIDFVQMEHL